MSNKSSRRANPTRKSILQSAFLALICCAFTTSASIGKEPNAHQACLFRDPDVPIPLLAIFCPVDQLTAGPISSGGGGAHRVHYSGGMSSGGPRHVHHHRRAVDGG